MTEIQSGNNFSVSTRFMQEVHKAATNDNTVDAKELARLVQVASEDALGLTNDEKTLLMSLFTKKLDTSGLTPEEKALFEKIEGSSTSQEVVDQNIQALKSVTAHENDANSLNFSKLQLVSETKSSLSKVTFGLLGGTNKATHNIGLSDGNIPAISNPPTTTSMTERRDTDRNNLISMMAPLEQELAEGLKPDSDVRKRLGESLGLDPNSAEVTEKIEALSKKITDFKNDPQKADWTSSPDLTALMNSYAQKPPVGNSRINSAYMSSLLGAYWNAWDSNSLNTEQKTNFQEGKIQTPASVEEINQTLKSVNEAAATDTQAALDKASTLIAQLDALKSSEPALYEQLMRGKDESALDLLRGQVSDLKQHLSTGGTLGQAQMTQLNNLYANLHQMGKTFAPDTPPVVDNTADITALQAMIDDPNLPESAKTEFREQIAKLQAQSASAPSSTPSQPQLDAIRSALADAKSAVSIATFNSQESASVRSDMVYELQQAESTLANLLTQHGISDTGRAQLQTQLDATRAALTQLKNNQDIKFENPDQQAAFNKVLQNVQQLRPAPVEPPPAPPASDTTPITGDVSIDDLGMGLGVNAPLFGGSLMGATQPSSWPLGGGNLGLALDPAYSFLPKEPSPLNFSAGLPPLTLNQPMSSPLGYSGIGGMSPFTGTSSLLNDPFLYSPSLGFGGYSGGLGGYSPFSSSLSLPSLSLSLNTPVADSSSPAPNQTPQATASRPSLANLFLEGVGENPANVKPLSPEMEQRQSKALETIAQIEKTGSPEAKAAAQVMKALVANPNGAIQLPDGSTQTPPPGSFEATLSILETYKDLRNQGIASADAEAVFLVAARSLKENKSPEEISEITRSIAQTGSKEEISKRLQQFRTEHFVESQQNVSQLATSLGNSNIANQLASDLLGPDFKSDPKYLTKMLQSPEFQTKYQENIKSAEKQLQDLNQQAASLVRQVQNSGLPRAQNVTTVDQAIEFLSKSGSAQHQNLLSQLREVNTEKAKLEPQIEGIRQLAAVSQNYTTMTTEMTTALDQLKALPANPVNTANIQMLEAALNELRDNGQLSPQSARAYGEFKVSRQGSTFEAAVLSTGQPPEGQQAFRGAMSAFFRAPASQKTAAWQTVVSGVENGSLQIPTRLEGQNRWLRALGLPSTNRVLSLNEFLTALRTYDPTKVISTTVREHGTIASANDIARSQLTGQPPMEDIQQRQQAYEQQAMEPDDFYSNAEGLAQDNPVVAAFLNHTRATEAVREHNYSLPPEQQAAAWGQTFNDYMASNQIFDAMDANISASIADLSLANDRYMVANGYPPLSDSFDAGEFAQPQLSQKAEELVAEADALADGLLLSPVPTVNGEQYLSDLVNKFIDIIRDLDFKTRALVAQQMAQRMVNNAITQFYKDKLDENNKHHQESLNRMQENFKAQITQTLESSLAAQANSTQGIAAMSGQVTGANLSGAMNKVGSASDMVKEMFAITDQMSPPLSDVQKMRILNQLSRVMAATGTSDLRDDQMAFNALNSDLSVNRFNR